MISDKEIIQNVKELEEQVEQLEKTISIVEWPEIILDNFNLKEFYLFKFDLINSDKRLIEIKYKKN